MASDDQAYVMQCHTLPVSAFHVSSIASLWRLSVALLSSFVISGALWAQTPADPPRIILPRLANTAEMDRLMLREIGDAHVIGSNNTLTLAPDCCKPEGALIYTLAGADNNARVETVNVVAPPQTVWQFVRQSRRLNIADNEKIENYRKQYQREAIWVSKILDRASPFVGHIVESLDARYLPVELALLPAIESGYQPDVLSAEQAAGIWQIVPATANEIGITQNPWFDGRSDLLESTQAAIDYLSYLNSEFHGNWLLTIAAYNAGPGRVRSAIRRNKANGLPTDFWSLKLPKETLDYVPKFLALVSFLRRSSQSELAVPLLTRGNAFEILDFGFPTSLDKVATASGIQESLLSTLNAGLVHGVTPPKGPHYIYVLKAHAEQVITAVSDLSPEELYTLPSIHTVVAGDSISTIARTYSLSQADLMALNELSSPLIKIGQKLAVRFDSDHPQGSIQYVVTIGDTLSDIAQRFSVQMDRILDAEGRTLESDMIHPGERLSIVLKADLAG